MSSSAAASGVYMSMISSISTRNNSVINYLKDKGAITKDTAIPISPYDLETLGIYKYIDLSSELPFVLKGVDGGYYFDEIKYSELIETQKKTILRMVKFSIIFIFIPLFIIAIFLLLQ